MSDEPGIAGPTVVIPYEPAEEKSSGAEIFVYLRPETNGVVVESSLLRVIERSPVYKHAIELAYLANIPGEFIRAHQIIEKQYGHKLPFAHNGKEHFTENMRERFESHFRTEFGDAPIFGAFAAIEKLQMTPEELFKVWVGPEDHLVLNCQTIKRLRDLFIVNYDLPALLKKNTVGTDITVMIFRSSLSGSDFHLMMEDMENALRSDGLIDSRTSASRAFHYSRGPFDQILDARGHLFEPDGSNFDIKNIQFYRYLRNRGVDCRTIEKALHSPIMQFRQTDGTLIEECLYAYTQDDEYETAYRKLTSVVTQFDIR